MSAIQCFVPLHITSPMVKGEWLRRSRNPTTLLHEPDKGYKQRNESTWCAQYPTGPALSTTLFSRRFVTGLQRVNYLPDPHCGMWVVSNRSCSFGLSKLFALFRSLRLLSKRTASRDEGIRRAGGGELQPICVKKRKSGNADCCKAISRRGTSTQMIHIGLTQ